MLKRMLTYAEFFFFRFAVFFFFEHIAYLPHKVTTFVAASYDADVWPHTFVAASSGLAIGVTYVTRLAAYVSIRQHTSARC
jgi:hypothetical protein